MKEILNLVLTFFKTWCYPSLCYGEHGKFSFRFKLAFHFLPVVNPETRPILKLQLFIAIANDFLIKTFVVRISAEYRNRTWITNMIIKTFNIFD